MGIFYVYTKALSRDTQSWLRPHFAAPPEKCLFVFRSTNMEEKIMGGAFILARKLFGNDLWLNKPSTWTKIWIYILGKVNHKDNGKFKRGEGFFRFKTELNLIGIDVSENMVKKFLLYARKEKMLRTSRSTRGTVVKVLNYDRLQKLASYLRTSLGTSGELEANLKGTPINKNDKNDKNVKNYIYSILEAWNKEDIIKCMGPGSMVTEAIENNIRQKDTALLIQAIKNYGIILRDQEYFYSNRWPLHIFIARKAGGWRAFTPDGDRWASYQAFKANQPKAAIDKEVERMRSI